MLSRAQWLGPSHFVVFVQTEKTWEVVQACCNKRDFLYLSFQRLNTANHITTAGKGDFLSPVPKGSGLFLSLLLWLVLAMAPSKQAGPRERCPLLKKEQYWRCPQTPCWEQGPSTFLRTGMHHTHLTIWMHIPSQVEIQETEAVGPGSKAAGMLEWDRLFCCWWCSRVRMLEPCAPTCHIHRAQTWARGLLSN